MALAGGDVGTVGARRRQHRQRHRLDDCDEEGAGGVRELADRGHRFEQPVEVRLGRDDPGDGPLGIGQEPLERSEIQRAGRVAVGDDGYLVDLEARPEIGSDRLPVVRVHGM